MAVPQQKYFRRHNHSGNLDFHPSWDNQNEQKKATIQESKGQIVELASFALEPCILKPVLFKASDLVQKEFL